MLEQLDVEMQMSLCTVASWITLSVRSTCICGSVYIAFHFLWFAWPFFWAPIFLVQPIVFL